LPLAPLALVTRMRIRPAYRTTSQPWPGVTQAIEDL
jgi:hypothetical protein